MKTDLQALTRLDGVVATGVFAAALMLYAHTAAPGLLLGDSAEFQTQAYTLGLTHPTGYPVYVLAARGFVSLFGGDLAWRVNVFSALCAAATLALVYLNARMLTGWRLGALSGAIGLGLAPVFWMHAAIAELYAPAGLLLAGVIFALLRWRSSEDGRWLIAAGALGGLSLGVHGTVALAAPAVLIYLLITPGQARWRAAMTGALIGVAGYGLAFLISDAAQAPSSYIETVVRPSVSVWGLTTAEFDQPWGRLRFLLEARQFQGLVSTDLVAGLRANGPAYLEAAQIQFTPVVLVLAVLGTTGLLLRQTREGILLGTSWLIQWLFVLNYGVDDILVFYIPGYVLLGMASGCGAAYLQAGVARALHRGETIPRPAQALATLAGLALLAITVYPSTEIVATAWADARPPALDEMGFGDYPYPVNDPDAPRRDAEHLVDTIEANAIVFTGWDRLYPALFVAHVERGRTGIAVHEAQPQEGEDGLADSALAYIAANWRTRPVYFTDRPGPALQRLYTFETLAGGLIRIKGER